MFTGKTECPACCAAPEHCSACGGKGFIAFDVLPGGQTFKVVSGPRTWWVAVASPSAVSEPFNKKREADDWRLNRSCSTFTASSPDNYADVCRVCGGHISMHNRKERE